MVIEIWCHLRHTDQVSGCGAVGSAYGWGP